MIRAVPYDFFGRRLPRFGGPRHNRPRSDEGVDFGENRAVGLVLEPAARMFRAEARPPGGSASALAARLSRARSHCRCFPVSSPINSRRSFASGQTANASLSWRAGHAWTAAVWRPAGHKHPELEQLALDGWAGTAAVSFRQHRFAYADTKPRKTPIWFALSEDRPLFAFAGLWTPWRGARGPKSAPVEGDHELFGLLTTEANAVVAPIHPRRCRSS
jgi:hypothetical protein